ncbi:hypothetical protein RU07_11770 [Agrobacterium tumefaciens]|uniref:Uncharacterized protein n=1 Tax=Agrobacterium tumefaciens TaxID=358 RepID=A0A0D0KRM4_AGRTU|nr:hypothetical protein RU07_11770 [Agrobacterium tumefaciens]
MLKTVTFARRKLRAHPELTVQAEDIAQDAYLHSCTHFDSTRGSLENYLYWRVLHEIDAMKRLSSTKNEVYNSDGKVVLLFKDRGPAPDEEYRTRELLDYIGSRNREAKVVAAWALHGLKSSKEIALQMGVPPSRVDYIRKILKGIMEERRLVFTEKIEAPSEVEN